MSALARPIGISEGPLVTIIPSIDEGLGNSSQTGHIPGATLLELGSLPAMASELAAGAVTVMCGHGEWAATAASLLERAGGRQTGFVDGAGDWSRALGRPVATGT